MNYCKTLDPDDYESVSEIQHARNINQVVQGRFEHPHRAWEYGIVLNALRKHSCHRVLDVGGGGSIFAPAAAWVGMEVTQVDSGDFGEGVAKQADVIGKPLPYVQQDFMSYDGGSFGAVTCLSVLEHVAEDVVFFRKLAEHVTTGGLLALTVDFWPDGEHKLAGHFRTYNAERLRALVATLSGFQTLGEPDYTKNIEAYVNDYTFASLVLRRER